MRIEGDDIVFKSGRRVQSACNLGIIGLSPKLDGITGGYDSGVCSLKADDEFDESGYTQKDKAEICDYMIKLWKKAKKIIKA